MKSMPAGEASGAMQAYLERRAGPGATDLPVERYAAAEARLQRMETFSLSRGRQIPRAEVARARRAAEEANRIDLGGWEPLGPGNQGGRTRHLLIDPRDTKIMYASAVTGGVWKTVDAGANWAPLTDFFPSLGIGGLTFEPGNPDVLYAGTGFWFNTLSGTSVLGSAPRGAGIYRSRNAGKDWEPLPSPQGTHFRYINEILVSRQDVNRIYVATATGIFRSGDAGQNWQQILNRGTGNLNGCQDMVMRTDQQTDYLFAACGTTNVNGATIFRNTDAAGSGQWLPVLSPEPMGNTTLALAPSSQSIVYALMASNGTDSATYRNSLYAVWRSTTNGDADSWEIRTSNKAEEPINRGLLSSNSSFYTDLCRNVAPDISGQAWIHNAIAVDPRDPERVWVAGIDIYRSEDGGNNWGIASFWQAADGPSGAHADVLGLWFPPDFDAGSRATIYATTDGGVYRGDNALAPTATGARGPCSTTNTQVRWQPLHGGYQSTQFYTGAVLPGGGGFFGGKQDNGTMRGTLAGKSEWVRLRSGDGTAVALDPRDPNVIYSATQNFGLARSRNGGRTFTTTLRGITEASSAFAFIAPLAMDPRNPDRLYAGATRFWRTNNQADNWSAISPALPSGRGNVTAIAVAPSDPAKVAYATSAGWIYLNDNAIDADENTEWRATQPRPGYVPRLAFDPSNADIVYAVYSQFNTAAGQSHVYRSTDGGRNWNGIDGQGDSGVPDIPVLSILIDPLDSNRLYLGTDLGVFVSLDGGGNWMRDQNPFATLPTEALVLERGSGAAYLYAFTFGRGVWRTMLPNTGSPCAYQVANPDATAYGGDLRVRVDTGNDCAWTAVAQSAADVLDVASPATYVGPGDLVVTAGLNASTTARALQFWLQDKTVRFIQPGALGLTAAAGDSRTTAANIVSLPYASILDSRTATAAADDPRGSCATAAPAKTTWWRVTPASDGTLDLMFQGRRYDVAGNSGVVVSAWTPSGEERGCAVVARNTGAWIWGRFQFAATAGQQYFIQVSATGATTNDGGLVVLGVRQQP
ncbi:MAG: hypothetical protein SGI92_18320 [Bryobacteraceae bacterium]|nr:hypothetical protein [Bryobacteraceae bacterium]